MPPGTFMVRFSSNAEHPTWFSISKVSADHKIRSVRVEHEPGSGNAEAEGKETKGTKGNQRKGKERGRGKEK